MFLRLLCALGAAAVIVAPRLAAEPNEHSRPVLSVREFLKNSSLLAHAQQTVVLDDEPESFAQPVIRYELDTGTHEFCWSRRGSALTDMTIEDASGEPLFKMPAGVRCVRKVLPAGIYQLRLSHSGKQVSAWNLNARVEVDPPSPPVVNPNGEPVNGWWAAQHDPADEPLHRQGRLRAPAPFTDVFQDGYLLAPFVADFSSRQIDEFSLFRLSRDKSLPVILGVPSAGKVTAWSETYNSEPPALWVVNDVAGCQVFIVKLQDYRYCGAGVLQIDDLGNQRFLIAHPNIDPYFVDYVQNPDATAIQLSFVGSPTPPGRIFELLFRFFLDGSQMGALQPGQAALFQTCGYRGKTSIFAPGEFALSAYDSEAITIDNSAKSVRLGNNTAIDWRSGSSQLTAIVADTACLPAGSAAPGGDNFEVLPLVTLLADPSRAAALNKKCIQCKLAGTHLENLDLDGWDFSGADLSGATLTHVKLSQIKLDGAVLTGTKFSCVDFSGSDPLHPVDLTSMDFKQFQWVQTEGCQSTFRYTLLSVNTLPPSLWKTLDLSSATFVDAKGQQLSSAAHPLDLSGVGLAGVSLEGVVLDYATGLAGANLSEMNLNGASLQHVDLSTATLSGAQLINGNLDGANLGGAVLTHSPDKTIPAAKLQGAFLRNVNLSEAHLSGADFTNASFYGTNAVGTGTCTPDSKGFTRSCATAEHADMNNTQFAGAYLFGVDFAGATIQGVQFANAFLVGANFSQAKVIADDSVGTNSGFSGAFLQGTNLAGAKSLTGVSLADAFVDFSQKGNTLYLKLDGQHTVFPDYWGPRGQFVCAEATYLNPTIVPADEPTLTCPDGNTYPNGCGPATTDGSNAHWKSLVDITQQASYQFDSTYTKAPADGTAICQFDPRWIGGQGLGRGKPHPHPHLHFDSGHDHEPETSQ